jgi:hypothetical protein
MEISDSELSAKITGDIFIKENQDASQFWIVVVAYSQDDSPIGIRKWESSSPLFAGDKASFLIHVYSLEPSINRVEIHPEALP